MGWLLAETLILALAGPWLLFPTLRPAATLAALAGLGLWWTLRLALTPRAVLPLTQLNGALLPFTIAVAVGIAVAAGNAVTALPELTLPKATGLILGLATWRYLVVTITDARGLRWAAGAYLLLGLILGTTGALSVQWSRKIPALADLIASLPSALVSLPEAPERGVNPNQLGGVLACYVPLGMALIMGAASSRRRLVRRLLGTLMLLGYTAALGALLILTQSRSGWIGAAVGALILPVLWLAARGRRRRLRIVGGILALLAAVGGLTLARLGPEALSALWDNSADLATDAVGTINLAGRIEIWSRALYTIQDFLFTGCGLGTFRRVVWLLYPLFTISPGSDFAHAHNILLQVAVDTGIPGLTAYLALLGTAGVMGWRVARRDPTLRPLALGLLTGLAGLHVYGLTDALALGSKPGLILWAAFGLLAAAQRVVRARSTTSTRQEAPYSALSLSHPDRPESPSHTVP